MMDYYSCVELSWDDTDRSDGELNIDDILLRARSFIDEMEWSLDLLEDIEISASNDAIGNWAYNRMEAVDIIALFHNVAVGFPDVSFYIRGMGENFGDMWMREIRGHEILEEIGPFEDD